MWQQDKGLTELIFLAGLVLLPLDNLFWSAGLPSLLIASALAYGIAWELPRLLFRRENALDQFAASWALTLVLACFYLGKSDRALAQMIREQGQAAAFNSSLWLINDGILLLLTIAAMMVLLALTTFVLHLFQPLGAEGVSAAVERVIQSVVKFFVTVLLSTVVGLGGGAWAVLVSNQGLSFGLVTWVTMWAAARGHTIARHSPATRWGLAVGIALMVAGLVGGWSRSIPTAAIAWLLGLAVIVAHFLALSALSFYRRRDADQQPMLELVHQRPKDAPFHVPWVGFYTIRFVGLVVAFFVVGAGWLWGLR